MRVITILIILTVLGCRKYIPLEDVPEYQDQINKAKTGVSNWIQKFALYPDSYEPISFSEYAESYTSDDGKKVPNSDNYIIKHSHRIRNKDSNMVIYTGYFLMEYDYFISIIETERSKATGKAFPPKTEIWMNDFGRPLNKQDSLELEVRHKQVYDNFINEMKDGLKEGDIYTEDPKDTEKLRNLLDTLDKNNK